MKDDIARALSEYDASLKKAKAGADKECSTGLSGIEKDMKDKLLGAKELREAARLKKEDLDRWTDSLRPAVREAVLAVEKEDKACRKRLAASKRKSQRLFAGEIVKSSRPIEGISVISKELDDADMHDLRSLADLIKASSRNTVPM